MFEIESEGFKIGDKVRFTKNGYRLDNKVAQYNGIFRDSVGTVRGAGNRYVCVQFGENVSTYYNYQFELANKTHPLTNIFK